MAVVKTRVEELLAKKRREENRRIPDEAAAKEVGISKSSFYNWKRNRITRFDGDQIIKLCWYFGVGIDELLIVPANPEEINPKFGQEIPAALAA